MIQGVLFPGARRSAAEEWCTLAEVAGPDSLPNGRVRALRRRAASAPAPRLVYSLEDSRGFLPAEIAVD